MIGQMGGFFHALGGYGILTVGVGGGIDALIHGVGMKALAKYLAKRKLATGIEPTEIQIDAEMDKADLMVSGIAAIPIGTFGALRATKYDYESNALDLLGNLLGGAMVYESCSTVEVLGSLLKLGEL